MMKLLLLFLAEGMSFNLRNHLHVPHNGIFLKLHMNNGPITNNNPEKIIRTRDITKKICSFINFGVLSGSLLLGGKSSLAIGNIYELNSQSMLIQDISFNVIETKNEAQMFENSFDNTCKILRETRNDGKNISVIGFGPDSLTVPNGFRPGIV